MSISREHHSVLRAFVLGALSLLLAAALGTVLSLGTAAPSYAATYPTLSTGSTGANVTSLQFLLTARGFTTTADGDFGSGTEDAVRAFQSGAGLAADGVAGPQTFTALVMTVRQGDDGAAVQALQVQLNKHGSGLDTDGDFGSLTSGAFTQALAQLHLSGSIDDVRVWRKFLRRSARLGFVRSLTL